jgi:hypothetical protein
MGREGVYTLPPIEFSYFDPVSKSYRILQTETATLTVVPAAGRKTKENLPDAAVGPESPNNFRNWLIAGILLLLTLSISGYVYLRKKKQQIAAITQVVALETAPVLKADPLAAAKLAAEQGKSHAFYRAISAGIWTVIAEKTGLPVAAQQKEMAITFLAGKGLSFDNLQLLKECWNQCEWALYVPSGDNAVNQHLLDNAVQLVTAIEQLT